MHMIKSRPNVQARGLPVGMNTPSPNNIIERLESLGRAEYWGPKSPNMRHDVHQDVKLWFVKPLSVPQCRCGQKIILFPVQLEDDPSNTGVLESTMIRSKLILFSQGNNNSRSLHEATVGIESHPDSFDGEHGPSKIVEEELEAEPETGTWPEILQETGNLHEYVRRAGHC